MLFWKKSLPYDLQSLYDAIYSGCVNMQTMVSCGSFHPDMIIKCYAAVCNDHPELYYLTSQPTVSCGGNLWRQDYILNISSIYNEQQREAIDHNCQYALSLIKQNTRGMSDIISIEKAVIEYIVMNTVYAIDNLKNQNMASVLCFKKAQCSGFAKAFMYIMAQYGFDCIFVEGSASDNPSANLGKQNNHAWNILKIGSEYYHVDVTMIVGANQQKSLPLNYIDFNCSDDYIKRTHIWDYNKYPMCNNTKYDSMNLNVGQTNSGNTISIKELSAYISKFINRREKSIVFTIKPSEQSLDRLHNEVMSVIRECITSMRVGLTYQVKATNNQFTICIEYK